MSPEDNDEENTDSKPLIAKSSRKNIKAMSQDGEYGQN